MQIPRAVIWDLDGTLVDSLETHVYAWQTTMAEYDFTMTRADFHRVNGKTMADAIPMLLGADLPAVTMLEIQRKKEALFRERLHTVGLQPMPGVPDWLAQLQSDGWLQGIATSGPRQNMRTMVATIDIEHYFGVFICAEDVTHGKPDPEPLMRAASLLGVDPARCVIVDDAAPGIQAAHVVGMRSLGVGPECESLQADITIATLADLPSDAFDALVGRQQS